MNSEEKKLLEVYKKDREYFFRYINDCELFMNGIYTVNLLKEMYKMGIINLNKNIYFLHKCMKEDIEFMKYVYPYSYIYDKKKMKSGISKNFYDKIVYCDDIDEEVINNSDIKKFNEIGIRIIMCNEKVREEVKEIFFEMDKINMEYIQKFKEGSKFNYEYCKKKGVEYLEMYMRISKEVCDEINKEKVYKDICERNDYLYNIIKNQNIKVRDILDILERYVKDGYETKNNLYDTIVIYCINFREDIKKEDIIRINNIFKMIDKIKKINDINKEFISNIINKFLIDNEEYLENFMQYIKSSNGMYFYNVNNEKIDYKEIFNKEEYMIEIKKHRHIYHNMFRSESITREFIYSIREIIKREKNEYIYYALCYNNNIGKEYVKKIFGYEEKYINNSEIIKYGLIDNLKMKKYKRVYDACMKRIEEKYIKHVFKNRIYEELIRKSCRPERVYNWNECMMEEYYEEYDKECEKYKK